MIFSSIYRYGKQRDKIQVNPAREVSQQKLNNGVIRYLKPEEEKRLRAVLQDAVDACGPQNEQRRKRLLHRIFELDVALGTGMRKGEQYGLLWSDIDFDRRVITLRDTKNGSNRTVPMIDDVTSAFRQLRKLSLERKDRSADRPTGTKKAGHSTEAQLARLHQASNFAASNRGQGTGVGSPEGPANNLTGADAKCSQRTAYSRSSGAQHRP